MSKVITHSDGRPVTRSEVAARFEKPEWVCNQRVRYYSNDTESEPEGTVIDVGYGAITIEWDDDHSNSNVPRDRWHLLEKI